MERATLPVEQNQYAAPTHRAQVYATRTSSTAGRKGQTEYHGSAANDVVRAPVQLCGLTFEGILDTGASDSAVSHTVVRRLGLMDYIIPTDFTYYAADGGSQAPIGILRDFPVCIGSLCLQIDIMVTPAEHYEVLIGYDWLRPAQADILFSRSRLRVQLNHAQWEDIPIDVGVNRAEIDIDAVRHGHAVVHRQQSHSYNSSGGHDTTEELYDQHYTDTNKSQQDAIAHQGNTAQQSLADGDTKQEGNDAGSTDDYEMPGSPADPDVGLKRTSSFPAVPGDTADGSGSCDNRPGVNTHVAVPIAPCSLDTFVSDAPVQATTVGSAVSEEEGSTSEAQNTAQGIDRQLPILAHCQLTSAVVGVEDRSLNMPVLAPHTMSNKEVWVAAAAAFSDLLAPPFASWSASCPCLSGWHVGFSTSSTLR